MIFVISYVCMYLWREGDFHDDVLIYFFLLILALAPPSADCLCQVMAPQPLSDQYS